MKKKIKKEVIEWVVLISVFGVIYLGGWHTEVIGRIQQVVLSTGVIQPSISEAAKNASYDFWLEDLDGNRLEFKSFENEVVFMNFWATWCPPCVAEMPDIHDLYSKQKNNSKFVMISLDQDETKAKAFIARKGFEFPVYFLRSRLPSTYNTSAIPTTYVLDRKGVVRIENQGMAKYDTDSFNEFLTKLSEGK